LGKGSDNCQSVGDEIREKRNGDGDGVPGMGTDPSCQNGGRPMRRNLMKWNTVVETYDGYAGGSKHILNVFP
jgi:hypothetical protein